MVDALRLSTLLLDRVSARSAAEKSAVKDMHTPLH